MFAVIQLADFPLQAARRAGVACGQTPPQALACCAQLMLWSRNPTAEAEAQSALLAAAAMLSPAVEDTAPA